MGRLAALVPKPRVNLTRFHGVFSPNSKLREYVVPQKPVEEQERPKPKAYSMTPYRVRGRLWAQRLKRVFVGAAIAFGRSLDLMAESLHFPLINARLDQPKWRVGNPKGWAYFF